jgi:hypothetical protein
MYVNSQVSGEKAQRIAGMMIRGKYSKVSTNQWVKYTESV